MITELELDLLEKTYTEQAWADGRPRRDVLALIAEVRRLRKILGDEATEPGAVIVAWSGKRHLQLPGSKVAGRDRTRAMCSEYTWGTEPDENGLVREGVKQGKRAATLPMCKLCLRAAGKDAI